MDEMERYKMRISAMSNEELLNEFLFAWIESAAMSWNEGTDKFSPVEDMKRKARVEAVKQEMFDRMDDGGHVVYDGELVI